MIKHTKDEGLPFPNIVLFSCAFGPAVSGNIYYVWKADLPDERHTDQLKINSNVERLLKHFSHSHKRRAREAMELIMEHKISPA